jgi:hypothetical protein
MGLFTGPGITPSLKGLPSNKMALKSGSVMNISFGGEGWAMINTGKYATFQAFDPISQIWTAIGGGSGSGLFGGKEYVYLDGSTNYRFANQTGSAVGALLTNAGSGYTSAPTVTASAGGSIWRAIVGGAVSTTVVVSNGGVNYTYPPIVLISAPPAGGLQATGYATISGGAVTSVTITNQGAGYTSPPTITFVNDPREGVNNVTAGYNAAAVTTLTGAATVTGLVCIDHGQGGLTAVPTLSFSGGGGTSAAATAIMCWSITAYTPTAGTGFTGPSLLSGLDAFPTAAAAYTNPSTQSGLVKTRLANILMPESGGAPTATGAVVYDGGIYTSVPTPLITTNGALITQTVTIAFTMGGMSADVEFTPV